MPPTDTDINPDQHNNWHESSFSGALVGSNPTAFPGSSEFEGFVE